VVRELVGVADGALEGSDEEGSTEVGREVSAAATPEETTEDEGESSESAKVGVGDAEDTAEEAAASSSDASLARAPSSIVFPSTSPANHIGRMTPLSGLNENVWLL
jgi:hypothetical protein